MAPIMAPPLRSRSLDAVPLANPRKRSRAAEDDDDEAPRIDKKVSITHNTPNGPTKQCHYQPRPLPFRTSPTLQHSQGFSQFKRPRPTSLINLGLPTPEEDGKVKRRSFPLQPLQSPPQSKSSESSNFSNAFLEFRYNNDSDTEMADSPSDASVLSASWTTPQTSPEDYEAPKSISFANAKSTTPASPRSSRTTFATPSRPQSSRFALLPQPQLAAGQRLPTPTYGYFPPLSSRKGVDNGEEVSPRTCSKSVSLRRGLASILPPSPISENEFESPTTTSMGDLLSQLKMGNPPTSHGSMNSNVDSSFRAKLGRRMAVDQGMMGVDQTQKGRKATVSMGYRADCEKCRANVPGHFNHVIQRV